MSLNFGHFSALNVLIKRIVIKKSVASIFISFIPGGEGGLLRGKNDRDDRRKS